MSYLSITNLSFAYRANSPVLHNVSLQLNQGEIGVLLGASGSGKTSLLRCLAGFETPSSGEIHIDSKPVFSKAHQLPPLERHIGYLFQNLALFPHMTVDQNIRYGLIQPQENASWLTELYQMTKLDGHQNKLPRELSGGEKQRVALARALAPKPKILLLDEPFSSLDPHLRGNIRQDVRDILKTTQTTTLLVTHDYEEAHQMAQQGGVLAEGDLQQWIPIDELFELKQISAPFLRKNSL